MKQTLSYIYGKVYSEPCEISKIELYEKIVNGEKPLTIFSKSSILNVWLAFHYEPLRNAKSLLNISWPNQSLVYSIKDQ